MKKNLSTTALLLLVVIGLTACGSKAPTVTVIGNSSSQEKTATPAPSK